MRTHSALGALVAGLLFWSFGSACRPPAASDPPEQAWQLRLGADHLAVESTGPFGCHPTGAAAELRSFTLGLRTEGVPACAIQRVEYCRALKDWMGAASGCEPSSTCFVDDGWGPLQAPAFASGACRLSYQERRDLLSGGAPEWCLPGAAPLAVDEAVVWQEMVKVPYYRESPTLWTIEAEIALEGTSFVGAATRHGSCFASRLWTLGRLTALACTIVGSPVMEQSELAMSRLDGLVEQMVVELGRLSVEPAKVSESASHAAPTSFARAKRVLAIEEMVAGWACR